MGNVALAINRPNTPPPQGWQWHPLTQLARMESGHTPSRRKKEYWDGDIPWIGIKDAKRWHGGTVSETLEKTTQLGIDNSSARVLPAGTVCLSRTASVGYAVKMGRDMATSQDFANWVCSDRLDPDFLRYLFLAEGSAFSRFSSGSVHQTIYYPELKAFYVCVPELDEQKRIVAVLDQAFAALDRAHAHAEMNRLDAIELQATSIEAELSSNELGEKRPVGPYVDLLTGFAFKSKGYSSNPSDIRLIRGDNIVQGELRWNGVKRWPINDRDTYKKYELALNDVLIAMDRTWVSAGIKYAVVDEDALPSLLVQRVARLRTKEGLEPRFLAYWIGSRLFEKYVLSIQTGLGVPHVSGKQLEAFPIRVPDPSVQEKKVRALDKIVKHTETMIADYGAKLAHIAELRQSLLYQAFSGELV